MKSRNTKLIIIFFMAFIVGGCAIKRGTINSYSDPNYQKGDIKKIAIFSIRNARFAPSEARVINRKMSQAIHKKNPNIIIISPSESRKVINESGLSGGWADFIDDYYTGGLANTLAHAPPIAEAADLAMDKIAENIPYL